MFANHRMQFRLRHNFLNYQNKLHGEISKIKKVLSAIFFSVISHKNSKTIFIQRAYRKINQVMKEGIALKGYAPWKQ